MSSRHSLFANKRWGLDGCILIRSYAYFSAYQFMMGSFKNAFLQHLSAFKLLLWRATPRHKSLFHSIPCNYVGKADRLFHTA